MKSPTITGVKQAVATGTVTVTGNTGSVTGTKNANVKAGPDTPRNCGDLDAYGLFIRSINTNLDHFGGHTEMTINMELGAFNKDGQSGSGNVRNFEMFLKDLTTLNKIKKSKHPGIVSQWGQLQTLLILSTKTDK